MNPIKRQHCRSVALALLGLAALAAATQVNATCMKNMALPGLPDKSSSAARLTPAVYRPGAMSAASFLPVRDDEKVSIVGLWQFQLNGFAVDWGTQAWHSDGTEIMFSGGQNPQTGDVCQGVWNHIAMGWTAPGAAFGLRVHFHMVVELDSSGNAFSGHYTASVYSVSPDNPFDESVQVASGTGNVTATRVTPD
jgi:hypothetical protein